MSLQALRSEVDVLIVGAGPAGLMMAAWMARLGINTRIVDKRGKKVFNGQADGPNPRTIEIFDSFDFGDRVVRESGVMDEICMWNPDTDGILSLSARTPLYIPGVSRHKQGALNQGRIERFFLDFISEHSDISVERGVLPSSFEFDESKAANVKELPITLTLKHLSEEEATPQQTATLANGRAVQDGLFRSNLTPDDTADLLRAASLNGEADRTETVKARFLVGCDGAHSWVRNQLGFKLEGSSTDHIWGVMDVIPVTDLPTIRSANTIHSAAYGSMLTIPREKKLIRIYVQLKETQPGESGRYDRSKVNPDLILKAAQQIMAPYKFTYSYCDWWTAYQVGQRVGNNYSFEDRVFLAGDAVHTHSPKAGQGMNVSIQDTYNLGWKIAAVLKGNCDASILKTYEFERLKVAKDLIAFDEHYARLFSGRPAKDVMDEEGVSMEEFRNVFVVQSKLIGGVAVNYGPSALVAKPSDIAEQTVISKQELAPAIEVGMRIPSLQVLNHSDSGPCQFHDLLKSNGRWRLVVFTGDLTNPHNFGRTQRLGDRLGSADSFIRRYTPHDQPIDSVIEVLTVHPGPRAGVQLLDLPDIFHPFSETEGWDYWKVYVDEPSYYDGYGNAYEGYGIDKQRGAVAVIRPDQYVSWVGEVEDYDDMERFFAGFMKTQAKGVNGVQGQIGG